MFHRDGDTVTISMTVDEYNSLLISLGYAMGHARKNDPDLYRGFAELSNSLSSGNPGYWPYKVPQEW